MSTKSIFKAIGIMVLTLFVSAIVSFSFLLEAHSFRASVSGIITNTQGEPIANAQVSFFVPNSDSIKYDCSTKTNSQGRYWIKLPLFRAALDSSPNYRRSVHISAAGFETYSTSIKLKKGNNSDLNYILRLIPEIDS